MKSEIKFLIELRAFLEHIGVYVSMLDKRICELKEEKKK